MRIYWGTPKPPKVTTSKRKVSPGQKLRGKLATGGTSYYRDRAGNVHLLNKKYGGKAMGEKLGWIKITYTEYFNALQKKKPKLP